MTAWQEALRRRGARISPEGVVTFSTARTEALAARDAAVVCALEDVAILRVTGADALDFLQGQLTQDVAAIESATWRFAAYCSPKGRMLANFMLASPQAGTYELIVPVAGAETLRRRLAMFVLRAKVVIEDVTPAFSRIGVGGPRAEQALYGAGLPAPQRGRVALEAPSRVFGFAGTRALVLTPSEGADVLWDRLATHAMPAGSEAWRWLTVEAGVAVVTPATADLFVPQTANWDALEGINFQKGCYTGQEIVARTQYLGRLKERAYLGHVAAEDIVPGARLYSDAFGEQPCGTIVDAAAAPEGGFDALAVLQIAAAEAGVRVGSEHGPRFVVKPLPYPLPAAAAPRRPT